MRIRSRQCSVTGCYTMHDCNHSDAIACSPEYSCSDIRFASCLVSYARRWNMQRTICTHNEERFYSIRIDPALPFQPDSAHLAILAEPRMQPIGTCQLFLRRGIQEEAIAVRNLHISSPSWSLPPPLVTTSPFCLLFSISHIPD